MDERQTVFALTGRCLAHEHAGIVSDAIVMSKAIGGGYPLDVLACRSKCDRRVPGTHAGALRDNHLGVVAGAATTGFIRSERLDLVADAHGDLLRGVLAGIELSVGGFAAVRGRCLTVSVDIVGPRSGEELAAAPDGALVLLIRASSTLR